MSGAMAAAVRVVQKIPATLNYALRAMTSRLRVCAYARVSTEKEEQESSFERQVEYYTKYIQNKPDWAFVKIYSDPGISGTKAAKRPGFMEMIEACRRGEIDKIICKSVQRFARNTVEALQYIRELKERNISIVFESEGIDTLTPGGEVLITILAGMAEQESRNISTNVKWGFNKKFAKGEIVMSTKFFLGYTKDAEKNIIIDEAEAAIVRRIFREYINGATTVEIAENLNAAGILSPMRERKGKACKWRPCAVRSILRQDKYTGNCIMGKTYKPDVLSNRRLNNGEQDRFYIPNSHPAIISQETFDLAQAEMNQRGNVRSATQSGEGRYSAKHAFSGMLVCGSCGSKHRRLIQGYGKGYKDKYATWICVAKSNLKACNELAVREETIQAAFLRVMSELIIDKDEFLAAFKANVTAEISDDLFNHIEALDEQISAITQEALRVNRENRTGTLSNLDYDKKITEIEAKHTALKIEKERTVQRSENVKLLQYRITDAEKMLTACTELTEFNERIFHDIMNVVIIAGGKATFRFKCGIEKEIDLRG